MWWLAAIAHISFCMAMEEEESVDSMMITKECSSAEHYPVQLHFVLFTYADGNYAYPVDISQPVTLWAQLDNSDETFTNVSADMTLQKKVQVFGFNRWMSIPTLGLLNGIQMGDIPTGYVEFELRMDPSSYPKILQSLLKQGHYLVRLVLRNSSNNKEILCNLVEFKTR
ncbi:hypothetical protein M514_09719 [Trichuris suis]|uniref:Uncharacterized protein n=1 Tax=Trichuris suis TaxID=68888 RepID=A0A085LWV6_9BILA|nr:hypothetical protein M513_09719 [Trichuris suis]KFD63667.1 hypothetical protein M514_09719 [Trichuris suis]